MTDVAGVPECIDPARVSDTDILAYAEGVGRPEFKAHLAACNFCQAELGIYQNFERQLSARLAYSVAPARAKCPDSQMLGEYALNLLNGNDKKQVKTHLDSCAFCKPEYALFFAELSVPDELAQPESTGTVAGFLRRVVATLVPPLTQPAMSMSLRSGGALTGGFSEEYQAEDITIILRVQPARAKKDLLVISGSAVREDHTPESLTGSGVRLLGEDTLVASETIDETGSFYFANVPVAPAYNLELALTDKIVIIPAIKTS